MASVKALLARRKKFDREDHAERVRLAILEVDVDGLKDAVHLKDAVQSSLGQQKVTRARARLFQRAGNRRLGEPIRRGEG
jgi:hypothetical protein